MWFNTDFNPMLQELSSILIKETSLKSILTPVTNTLCPGSRTSLFMMCDFLWLIIQATRIMTNIDESQSIRQTILLYIVLQKIIAHHICNFILLTLTSVYDSDKHALYYLYTPHSFTITKICDVLWLIIHDL